MHESRLAEFGKVFDDDRLPRLAPLHVLCTAILKVERSRIIHAPEKHERMGTVGEEPYLVGRERQRSVRCGKRLIEVLSKKGGPGHGSKLIRRGSGRLAVGCGLRLFGLRRELLSDGENLLVVGESLGSLAISQQGVSELSIHEDESGLPVSVVRFGSRELLTDGDSLPVIGERLGSLAVGQQGVTELFIHVGEIALPASIGGFGSRELLSDGESLPAIAESLGSLAVGQQGVGERCIHVSETALPVSVVGFGSRERLSDGESLLVIGESSGSLAVGQQGIGQSDVAETE